LKADPEIRCYLEGGPPGARICPYHFKIVDSERNPDGMSMGRQRRLHGKSSASLRYLDGHRVGRWTGITLVVDVTSVSRPEPGSTGPGIFHSYALPVVETLHSIALTPITERKSPSKNRKLFSRPTLEESIRLCRMEKNKTPQCWNSSAWSSRKSHVWASSQAAKQVKRRV